MGDGMLDVSARVHETSPTRVESQPMVDPAQPMSVGAAIAIVGVLITWVLFGIAIRKFVVGERERKRKDDAFLETLIEKICKSFTESDQYQLRRDRAMIAVAQSVADEAFRIRAPSFVDAGVDGERRQQTERRLDALEKAVSALRTDFATAAASIAREVVREMREQGT